MVTTSRIAAPIDQNLTIRSDSVINLHGTEGTRMEGKEMLWSADQDIYLKSVNGSIVLSGKEGVFIDMKSIPIAMSHDDKGFQYNDAQGQFKVCVCMPQGKLFRLPVPSGQAKVSCSHVNLSPIYNPCL
jgi:beta-sarcoglycan